MAYTFGGGTGDDINATIGTTMGADNRAQFVAGWWRPTTLTATRGLWSAGNVFGAEIDTTTDELRLRTDNTTDGQWTTTGVDLVVDEWTFLAFLSTTENTGVLNPWRVWRGSISTAPTLCTVAVATAPTGNFTGSAAFTIGNKGTGTVAFQGDIADVYYVASQSTYAATTHPLFIATTGVINAEQEAAVYDRFVLPLWEGNLPEIRDLPGGTFEAGYWDGLAGGVIRRYLGNSASQPFLTPTINGAVVSQVGGPRARVGNPLHPTRLVTRR